MVRVTFDPTIVTYRDILEVFFGIHDPTTLNRQGNDVGTQYRSVIYYHSEDQKKVAEDLIREIDAERVFARPVVTAVEPAEHFYIAEDYHQEYFAKNPHQPYCMFVVGPKVEKFRKKYKAKQYTKGA